jgi:hypothetical protein
LTPFLEEESCIVSRERVSEFKLWLGQWPKKIQPPGRDDFLYQQ